MKPAPSGAAPLAPGGAGADGRRRQRAHSPRRGAPCSRPPSKLAAEGVTSLAIVFLHSYANPAHERQAAELLARPLSRPHAVDLDRGGARDPRVRARLHHRHQRLHQAAGRALHLRARRLRIAARGIAAPLLLMLSNGGLTNIEEAKRTPVQLLESGPAAGALVAAHLGAARRGQRTCWRSTWAAPPPSSRSSRTASPRSPTASRPRARSASSRAAACRCASRRWS